MLLQLTDNYDLIRKNNPNKVYIFVHSFIYYLVCLDLFLTNSDLVDKLLNQIIEWPDLYDTIY